jgi:maleylpyruvate isomerase
MGAPAELRFPADRACVEAVIEAVQQATESLFATIAGLTESRAREPSLLPGWSRGHVLTHLARNADALCNLLSWARTGVETPMYLSRDQRKADIEAGSGRPVDQLVDDVHTSSDRLLAELRETPEEAWRSPVRFGTHGTPMTGARIPHLRRVEVEVLGWLIGRTDGVSVHCDQPLPQRGAWR